MGNSSSRFLGTRALGLENISFREYVPKISWQCADTKIFCFPSIVRALKHPLKDTPWPQKRKQTPCWWLVSTYELINWDRFHICRRNLHNESPWIYLQPVEISEFLFDHKSRYRRPKKPVMDLPPDNLNALSSVKVNAYTINDYSVLASRTSLLGKTITSFN